MMVYRVSHPEYPTVEVAAVDKVRAVAEAARSWGLTQWTAVARACEVVELRQMPVCANERRPVEKINREGNAVAWYPSVRAAAVANYMNRQSVLDRCNGITQKPYGEDGCTFRFAERRRP